MIMMFVFCFLISNVFDDSGNVKFVAQIKFSLKDTCGICTFVFEITLGNHAGEYLETAYEKHSKLLLAITYQKRRNAK